MLIYKITESNMEIINDYQAFRNVHDKEDKYIQGISIVLESFDSRKKKFVVCINYIRYEVEIN